MHTPWNFSEWSTTWWWWMHKAMYADFKPILLIFKQEEVWGWETFWKWLCSVMNDIYIITVKQIYCGSFKWRQIFKNSKGFEIIGLSLLNLKKLRFSYNVTSTYLLMWPELRGDQTKKIHIVRLTNWWNINCTANSWTIVELYNQQNGFKAFANVCKKNAFRMNQRILQEFLQYSNTLWFLREFHFFSVT